MSEVKSVRFHAATDKMPANVDVQQFHALRLTDDKTGIVVTDSAGNALGVVLPVSDQAKPGDSVDTVSVADNAFRDAAAIIAAIHKGDTASAHTLFSFYHTDLAAQAELVGALAGFAGGILKIVDEISDEVATVHGVSIPGSRQVLSSVLLKMAEQPSPVE